MQKNWTSLFEAINTMDSVASCLVLRNYEGFMDGNIFLEEHYDIDFLCDKKDDVIKVLDAKNNSYWGSPDHVIVLINGLEIKFGLRYVGDGYYDPTWEKRMLANKKRIKDKFYVMSDEDYFYSLAFHALFQKKTISNDYRKRLRDMSDSLSLNIHTDEDLLEKTILFLRENDYFVYYPKDATVPVNYSRVPHNLIKMDSLWHIRRCNYKVKLAFHKIQSIVEKGIQKWVKR